jgi:hypothetical protein
MRVESWNGELGGPRWWARALSFAAVVGALLGVAGPFGSFLNDRVLVRVLYWGGTIVAGTAIAGLLIPLLMRAGNRIGLPRFFSLAIAVFIVSAPIAGMSWIVGHWLWSGQIAGVTPADWYGETLLTCAGMTALWVLVEAAADSWRRGAASAAHAAAPSIPGRFVGIAEPVMCLQMEDHYVRVHRASGSILELMPLQEAIARFGGAGGLQVHRSWWVAGAAVAGAERDARNWRLRLTNGLIVPLARNRVAEARARGWIGGEPP